MKSIKNIKNIINRKSFIDFLIAIDNKKDLKEWSEVGGVFDFVRKILKKWEPDIVFDIGCGKRPTLGTMMALNYPWDVISIDPKIDTNLCDNIHGIKLVKSKLSDFNDEYNIDHKYGLVLCNHSHVKENEIKELLEKFDDWVYITVPCCVDNTLKGKYCINYIDEHMWTTKNKIYIYTKYDQLNIEDLY